MVEWRPEEAREMVPHGWRNQRPEAGNGLQGVPEPCIGGGQRGAAEGCTVGSGRRRHGRPEEVPTAVVASKP
jgi:hypothetical protein